MLHTYSITVMGNVQGVFYRQSARETAVSLGISGMVLNQSDGSVAIVATGTKEQLDKLVAWCYNGPPKAKVEQIICHEISLQRFEGFNIAR